MQFLKKVIITLALGVVFLPAQAFALDLGQDGLKVTGDRAEVATSTELATLPGFLGFIIQAVLAVTGVILFVLFIYAGILWMTAQGDSKQTSKATDIMRNALIGLVLTLSSYAMVEFLAASTGSTGILINDNLKQSTGGSGISMTYTLVERIGLALNVILSLLGVLLLLLFLYAGFLWMTARGDSKQTTKATDIMKNAAIGLVLVLLAGVLTKFIIEKIVEAKLL